MIGELILSTLLQVGDVASTHVGEIRGGRELNPLMSGNSRYVTSGLIITGETWSLTKTHGLGKKLLIGGLVIYKGFVIQHNLRIKK